MRGAISFGLLVGAQSTTFYFLKLADRFFLARYIDLHEVGIYSFAYTLSNGRSGVAIATVPEPSSASGSLAAAFLLFGVALRRRSR